jgi:hypothetical protein
VMFAITPPAGTALPDGSPERHAGWSTRAGKRPGPLGATVELKEHRCCRLIALPTVVQVLRASQHDPFERRLAGLRCHASQHDRSRSSKLDRARLQLFVVNKSAPLLLLLMPVRRLSAARPEVFNGRICSCDCGNSIGAMHAWVNIISAKLSLMVSNRSVTE